MDYHEIRWVCALKAEAIPIIEYLKMSRTNQNSPFEIYKDSTEKNWLVVSGIGQVNAAAAAINLHYLSGSSKWAVWVNLGIAGGHIGAYGSFFLVDNVTQAGTNLTFYLTHAKGIREKRAGLLTVDKVNSQYDDNLLFDMEGGGFVQAVTKLVSKELIVVLKIISDGPKFPIQALTRDKISDLVRQNMNSIEDTVSKFLPLARIERDRLFRPEILNEILGQWKFSETQVNQLESLVNRVCVAKETLDWYEEIKHSKSSRDVIFFLKNALKSYQTDWSKS